MSQAHLQRDSILNEILNEIDRYTKDFKNVNTSALKEEVLKPVINYDFDPEVQIRGFIHMFKDTTTFKTALENIGDKTVSAQIRAFIDGSSAKEAVGSGGFKVARSPGVKHHFSLLTELKDLVLKGFHLKDAIEEGFDSFVGMHKHIKDLPIVYEDAANTKVMEVYSDVKFENWGRNVANKPKFTFLPTSVLGVQNLVKFAIQKDLRVRCAGFRHSWSNTFSEDNQIFVSFVGLEEVNTLPDPMSLEPEKPSGQSVPELKTIELKDQTANGKRLCRMGVAVTNEDFRRWANANDQWALPADVILVEVTIGGVNGPICHGAGRRHNTISDYVRAVEYVDCRGELRKITNPDHLKAAAGCFGLLGVVTHITFELDAMSYAVMEPRKVDVGLAIPPINKIDIPPALRSEWYQSANAAEQLADALKDFNRRADDYYSEWFWFPYQQKVWINTWNTTTDSTKVVSYPDDGETFLQWVQGWLGGVVTSHPLFNVLPGYWQAQLFATMGMAALPPTHGEDHEPSYITQLPNALHFRRGVQNMRVRDIELQIPIPHSSSNPSEPDFSIVQRAWWDAIRLVYDDTDDKKDPSSPLRLTLELRIMGGSNVHMAPQHGNEFGTASIEVVTLPDTVTDGEWYGFMQRIVDKWTSYDKVYGQKINVRPHLAKEWEGLEFPSPGGKVEAKRYLKDFAMKDQIAAFKDTLGSIGKEQGWEVKDLKGRFSNQLWDHVVFE